MADVGSIIAIAEVAWKAIRYVSDVRQAPEEWNALEKDVINSKNILKSLHRQLQSPHLQGRHVQEILESLSAADGPLLLLKAALTTIQVKLEKPEKKRHEYLKQFKWPFKASEVRELLADIQRAKADIRLTLSQAGIYLETEILQDTNALIEHASQADLQRVLEAISPHDFFARQQSLQNKALPGTVRWFLDGPSFRGWTENRAPVLLWCHGIPGAGKTVLASTAFEEIMSRYAELNVAVLVMFCQFDHGETQTAAGTLSAYLKQVVELRGEVSKQVQMLYGNRRGRPPPDVDNICAVLTSELAKFERTFFILDGLDEIIDNSERTLLLEKLQAMVPCPKLLVTSRPLQDLSTWFFEHAAEGLYRIEHSKHSIELPGHLHEGCIGSAARSETKDGQTVLDAGANETWKLSNSYRCNSSIDIASRHNDIERAVDERIKRSDDLKMNIERAKLEGIDVRSAIMKRVKADSQNTFLLLGHQMDILADQVSPRDVLSALETLPTKMDEVHERIFARLRSLGRGDLANKIRNVVAIVASARRPLTIQALEHAISVTADDTYIDRLKVPDTRNLISKAFGLVVIEAKTNHVRLAHETAADYIRNRAVGMPNGDRLLAEASMAYLQLTPICEIQTAYEHLEQKKKSFAFLQYATSFWASHVRSLQDEFLNRILGLLRNDMAVKAMVQMMWQDDPDWDATHHVHGLHLAAYFGLTAAVTELVRTSTDVDILDCRGTTPLMYAALKGENDVVACLLEAGADPPRTCERGRAALHRACQYRRIGVVQLLLQCSKDIAIQAPDEQFGDRTALAWAIHHGSKAMLEMLLRGYPEGAQVSPDHDRNNLLILAAAKGQIDIFQTLLKDGRVPLSSTDDRGAAALTIAARNRHTPLIDILLQEGVDLEARNDLGSTALLTSLPDASNEVSKLLVTRGADVNALSYGRRGILFVCAHHNRPGLMRFFLELGRGLDVNIQAEDGATPLYNAVEACHLECVKVLLEHGARTDVRATTGLTTVSMARERAFQEILSLLLIARAKEGSASSEQSTKRERERSKVLEIDTPIHAAVVQLDVPRLTAYLDRFLEKGLDINTLDAAVRQTALHITARCDLLDAARLLLDRGAKFEVFDKFGFRALHAAVFHRSLGVTEELICRGADVNQVRFDGKQRPLHLATERRFPKIAFCLVKNGAIVDPNDRNAPWLIDAAAQFGEFEVLRKAVDAGVPFNERNSDGVTPYQRAMKHGNVRVAKYLFEQAQREIEKKKSSGSGNAATGPMLAVVDVENNRNSKKMQIDEADAQAGAEDPRTSRSTASGLGEKEAAGQVLEDPDWEGLGLTWRCWVLITLIGLVLAATALKCL
ncbi:hypothetical protein PRZ48_009572 [Zasmidium cellare]|uniref:NACHT domain-containing protein n=1 Tax=Zasmidium cellare TaxID=395010 RepID=A0ABR0ECR4_ZASCE|nr:hypothetical protein PRZ48_009572 [Zasmidium cellare]